MPEIKPFGSWKSPITAELIAAGSIRLDQVVLTDDAVYWIEGRPAEAGRSVIVKRSLDGKTSEVNPAPFNARSRVHEYGGGSYWVSGDTVYFCHFADNQIYSVTGGAAPKAVTNNKNARYADGVVDTKHNRIFCVRETHHENGEEADNEIVSIDIASGEERIVAFGFDFFAYPRLSPNGRQLAWICWNHPNMPWDGTELWVANVTENGGVEDPKFIAGDKHVSITQPEWSPDGQLYFVSEQTGWWNIWRSDLKGNSEQVLQMEAEFGRPLWVFGMSCYGFRAKDEIICCFTKQGSWSLARIHARQKQFEMINTEYTDFNYLRVNKSNIAFIGGSPKQANSVVLMDASTGESKVLQMSTNATVDPAYVSAPQPIEFPTSNGLTAHAYYYAPKNPDYEAPAGDLPPLLVNSHGGPTGATSDTLNLNRQYWTSRGVAVLDVNYGGSTGYGRNYRERLKDNWGIVDVDDCVNGAKYLAEKGLVDAERMAISGGSAGGYTTLCALTFQSAFKAGASYFGVSDLEALAQDTHKFESRYEDGLVGPYPDSKEIYKERSPINHVDKLSCPIIFLQGLEDKVVPPNQSKMMVEALKKKGLPVAYVTFEGEQHGFRKADTIKQALESELYFYSKIFKFEPADKLAPVEIMNAP